MAKCYTDLTPAEQRQTYENYQHVCKMDENFVPFNSFEEYHKEQIFLEMAFDADTLECLG